MEFIYNKLRKMLANHSRILQIADNKNNTKNLELIEANICRMGKKWFLLL